MEPNAFDAQAHVLAFSQLLGQATTLADMRFVAQSAVESLNRLSHGVVILDDTGKLITLNTCGQQFLKNPYRLSLKAGRLTPRDVAIRKEFQGLISRCVAISAGDTQFHGGIVNVPGNGQFGPLRIHVYPMRRPAGIVNIERCAVVLFIFGPTTVGRLDETVLRTIFGFTSAESRLVAAMLQGMTLTSASKTLKISINTARTQLKSVFTRVGVHRQAELVRLVLPFVTASGT